MLDSTPGQFADAFIKLFREIGIDMILILVIFIQAWSHRNKGD